jgi:hypothetical protein
MFMLVGMGIEFGRDKSRRRAKGSGAGVGRIIVRES